MFYSISLTNRRFITLTRIKNGFVMMASLVFFLSVGHSQAAKNTTATPLQNNTSTMLTNFTSKKLSTFTEFEQKIAQRMSLDIRYFCEDIEGKTSVKSSLHCRKALTALPKELATLISETSIGGIVLFAENVENTPQIIQLTHDIQQASLQSTFNKPLIIAIDQEGGRVARFAKMTGFAGNMAIGASFPKHNTYFATQVNAVIAKELKALGINNNYAPVVDVNTNPKNPVINTRSFGESAEQVAKLGASAVNAIQAQKVMATLKHFPGHGDTHVDSHLGLPRVDHNKATIDKVDLAPFAWAIKHSDPAMIMTAHIQYPALDNSLFVSKSGDKLIRPATMSRKILTGLLRDKMGFEGIIATDALDMAGITHYFSDVEAVVETFTAGADLAVMPFKVRTLDDIKKFYHFIKDVAQVLSARIDQGHYSVEEFEQSIARLNTYKNKYIEISDEGVLEKTRMAESIVAQAQHLSTEQDLANAAVTLLKNNNPTTNEKLIPLTEKKIQKIHLVVATQHELDALQHAIKQFSSGTVFDSVEVSTYIAERHNATIIDEKAFNAVDIVLATIDIKTASLVDLGGMDDMTPSYGSAKDQHQKRTFATALKQQLQQANQYNIPSILIAKGSPFLIEEYRPLADAILLNFDDRIYQEAKVTNTAVKPWVSPGFNASIKVILGKIQATGVLPVSLR